VEPPSSWAHPAHADNRVRKAGADGAHGRQEHVGDLVDLGSDLGPAGLGEDRADGPGDHLGMALADPGQGVAHEVDPAALPARALHRGRDRLDEAAVGVADDQLKAAQATVLELAQQLGPEGFGLAVSDLAAQDFPSAVGTHPSGDHDGLRHDPLVKPDLAVGRIEEHIRERDVVKGPGAPRRDVGVELSADPA